MATSINVRLTEELEEKLKSTVEEVKKKTPLGAEVNNSTIVRGALEDFIKRVEDEEKGILNIPIFLNFNLEEGESFRKILKQIIQSLGESKLEENLSAHLEMIYIESLKHIK